MRMRWVIVLQELHGPRIRESFVCARLVRDELKYWPRLLLPDILCISLPTRARASHREFASTLPNVHQGQRKRSLRIYFHSSSTFSSPAKSHAQEERVLRHSSLEPSPQIQAEAQGSFRFLLWRSWLLLHPLEGRAEASRELEIGCCSSGHFFA